MRFMRASARRLHPGKITPAALLFLAWVPPALSQTAASNNTTAPSPSDTSSGLWERSNLLGDMGGLRTRLAGYGASLSITDVETLLGNVSGGVKQGAAMQGLTTAAVQLDTGKALGLPGGTFNVSALQIHGNNDFSTGYLRAIQTANGNEADNATRLWELWYDQVFSGGRFDIKFGQQSLDQEFIISKYSDLFVNTIAGWPAVPSADLYAGGPTYPLSSLGGRVQVKPTSTVTILAGVFDDNPPGGPFANDPQSLDAGGTKFNLNTGALFLGEVQFATDLVAGLPGTYKLGFWYDTGGFPDQAVDQQGLSLASPASDGVAAMHRHNHSIYGVVDQTLWRAKGSARSLNAFFRVTGAPGDRNLLSFSANGGLTVTDPLPGRANDTAGFEFGVAKVSNQAANLNRAATFFSGVNASIRGTETLIELTYQAQVTPWLQVQPDLQFILNPGGGLANPDTLSTPLRNEVIVGVRSGITF
jgi:porin